jgi:two-component system, NtrC family, sensor kinase
MNSNQSEMYKPSQFTFEQAEKAKRALLERPKFTIRLRIILVFLITFALTCGIIIAAMVFISKLGKQQEFLEKAVDFEFEVQQARRYEKDYFLYGTNLYDALNHVHNAENIKNNFYNELRLIINDKAYQEMSYNLQRYKELLETLQKNSTDADSLQRNERLSIESEIRNHGAAILVNASNAIEQERLTMHTWLNTSMIIAIAALLLILVIGIVQTTYVSHQINMSYSRFEEYTKRIAKGDFSFITPARKYRDEFTNLAIAINGMILELKNREEQLLQSRKMAAVGTLTAGIAHELNNPLNNISLIIESMIDEYDQWDKNQKMKMLKDMFTQVERAGATVANLLDFTRTDRSFFNQIHINDVLNKTLNFVANEIHINKIELSKELGANLPEIKGNEHNLQQVFLNIFLNAIQAMPDGGILSVKSYIEDHNIRIDISDTGVGIAPENVEKIFDPFFTTKKVGEGTGLGLSVSYGIIKQHHGQISVESKLGNGSVFTIKLPISLGEQV